MSLNRKINVHLLNILIQKHYKSKREFAQACDIKESRVYNWTLGIYNPTYDEVVVMSKHLNVAPLIFYIPGVDYIKMGVESAITRWSLEQQTSEGPTLSSNEALQFIRFSEPEVMEETAEEAKEESFTVQGPTELSDTTEPEGD